MNTDRVARMAGRVARSVMADGGEYQPSDPYKKRWIDDMDFDCVSMANNEVYMQLKMPYAFDKSYVCWNLEDVATLPSELEESASYFLHVAKSLPKLLEAIKDCDYVRLTETADHAVAYSQGYLTIYLEETDEIYRQMIEKHDAEMARYVKEMEEFRSRPDYDEDEDY